MLHDSWASRRRHRSRVSRGVAPYRQRSRRGGHPSVSLEGERWVAALPTDPRKTHRCFPIRKHDGTGIPTAWPSRGLTSASLASANGQSVSDLAIW